jgi:HAD superfamily phosphoserine phosphatase-like hydrolase
MQQPLAIFDIDGTIFRKNLHFELINQLVLMGVFPQEARDRLTRLYSRWLEHEGTYGEYRDALVKLYAENIGGVSVDTVKIASRKMIEFHQKRTYIFAERLIKYLREKNYYIISVSGSPLEAVREFNRVHLNFDEVFGTIYEAVDGSYTGRESEVPVEDKGKFVREYMQRRGFAKKDSYGIGDTQSDAGFLKLVDNPIAFNPDHELKAIAEVENWKIKVERKDVVYDIV